MGVQKIFLSGVHGSGKTTLLNYLQIKYPSIPVYQESAYLLNQTHNLPLGIDHTVEIERNQIYKQTSSSSPTPESQLSIFNHSLQQNSSPVSAIYDRCLVDAYVYTQYFSSQYGTSDWKRAEQYMHDVIKSFFWQFEDSYNFFLEPQKLISPYQVDIYFLFIKTYDRLGLMYTTLLWDTPENRLQNLVHSVPSFFRYACFHYIEPDTPSLQVVGLQKE